MTRSWRIGLTINGVHHDNVTVDPRLHLADFLRHQCGQTGTHVGCEHGSCGACTVMVDGACVRSCLMLAVQADGAAVQTIEGVAQGQTLHPLQQAFIRHHALQCGFCTPGMVITLLALLRHDPAPDAETVREAISGNLCRCTGYQSVVAATLDAAATLRREGGAWT
jgi:aerobic-type carbon monoxide dehydrogenase small subunit (CoxS/CutS family)